VGVTDQFTCLLENFTAVYQADFSLFWRILHAEESRAKKCEGAAPSRFLRLHRVARGDADTSEFVMEVTEKLLLQNPECVLAAASQLSANERAAVVDDFRHPLVVDEPDVRGVPEKFRNDKKYKSVVEAYFAP